MNYNSNEYNKWSMYYLNEIIDKNKINISYLSENININEYTINKNLHIKWKLNKLCNNNALSYNYLEYIIKYNKIEYTENELFEYNYNICKNKNYLLSDALNNNNNNLNKFSLNSNIYWNDIEKNKLFSWDFSYLSRNTNINIENILNNLHYDWDYCSIVRNPIFHISDITKNKSLLRCSNEYFINPNFDLIEYMNYIPIKSYLEINRDIHSNENFNIKMHNDIKTYFPEFNFDYSLLGDKKNITINYIFDNPNYNWNIDNISFNITLSIDLLKNKNYKWNYYNFCKNTFDLEREKYIKNYNTL